MADRLYRSRDDRMLAGVAAGVADALDADPSLIRIAWALLAIFTGGIAFVVYIVMAIVVPEAPAGWTTPPGAPWTPNPPAPPVPGWPPAAGPPPASAFAAAATTAAPEGATTPVTPEAATASVAPEPATMPLAQPNVLSDTPALSPSPSYWASDRDTRRAARRARRDARGAGRGGLVVGIVLIALGGVFLAREFVPWFDWNLWWPVGLIALGGLLLLVAVLPGRDAD